MSEHTSPESEPKITELPPEAISGEEAEDVKGGALSDPPDPIRNLNPNVNLNPNLNPNLKNPGNR